MSAALPAYLAMYAMRDHMRFIKFYALTGTIQLYSWLRVQKLQPLISAFLS